MAKRRKPTSRELMERAVQVMRESVHEPRTDGRKSLFVGAVLLTPDNNVDTAFRGELRNGDHAEFTLLERKHRADKLDGSVLFTTLEPCTLGSRTPPKLSCAERIVLARIKEVWVGIEDPHPKVDRRGIQYLIDNDVTVSMFDRDLQEEIQTVNSDFLNQATRLDRSPKEGPGDITLSELEKGFTQASYARASTPALSAYRDAIGMSDTEDTEGFKQHLRDQGLLSSDDRFNGFGVLLFAPNPRVFKQQAGLLVTLRNDAGDEEVHELDGPLVLLPAELEQWLEPRLPKYLSRSSMKRKEESVIPFELIREGVVNALVHRNYDIVGAKCQLIISPESVVVRSPGEPVHPITLAQLQSFSAPTLSRNPILHYVFNKLGYAEERGFGLRSLRDRTIQLGLPLPKFTFNAPYLDLRLPQSGAASLQDRGISLSTEERRGWDQISRLKKITRAEYSGIMGFDARKAQRHLAHFIQLGLLSKLRGGRGSEYDVRA